jgi:hypothetical protein
MTLRHLSIGRSSSAKTGPDEGILTFRPLPHPWAGGSICRNKMMTMIRPFVTDSRTVAGCTVYFVDPSVEC